MKRPDGRICIGGARRRDPSCSWYTSEWAGPETQPGSDDDSKIIEPVAARLREFLSQLLGGEEPVPCNAACPSSRTLLVNAGMH